MKCLKCEKDMNMINNHLICPICRELMEHKIKVEPDKFTAIHKID